MEVLTTFGRVYRLMSCDAVKISGRVVKGAVFSEVGIELSNS